MIYISKMKIYLIIVYFKIVILIKNKYNADFKYNIT